MSQEGKPDFYTQKGYQMRSQHALTGAMEDYLEMICRQAEADGCARIGLLAEGLNVRPSSASKMVYQLRALGLVAFEKYGLIQPTEKGWSVGRWLLHRHEVLHRFFCMLNGSTDELELVEQVEHYLNEDTVRNLEALLERLESLNRDLGATILMVTHDAYSASYAARVLFLKDGRLFHELLRGERGRPVFYHEILDVLALLGGDVSDVI